jgi:hypothetical protein
MVPDSSLNAAFFIGQNEYDVWNIESFDLTHFTPVNLISPPNIVGNPLRLIRWGQNGLAFNTDSGWVYIVQGTFVGPVTDAVLHRLDLKNVHRPWTAPKRRLTPEEKR